MVARRFLAAQFNYWFARTVIAVAALVLSSATLPRIASTQSVTVSISPASGNTHVAGPLSVTIYWCAVGAGLESGSRVITLNGQSVLVNFNWSAGSQGGCDDYATSSGTVTLGAGMNSLFAAVDAYYEPPPPPTCPPICDDRPSRPKDPLTLGDDGFDAASESVFVDRASAIDWVSGSQTANWGTGAPIVSFLPHASGKLPVGADVVFAHSTPAYFSLGAARSVSVAYNSSTVRPTPVMFLDVSSLSGVSPTAHSIEVRRASDGSLLTLLNGAQVVYFTPATTTPLRLAVALDAQTNALGTGFHDVNVTVTSHLATGNQSTTVPTRLLVVDRNGSAFGRGVDLPGVQRVHPKTGTWSVVVAEGNGSATFFESNGQCELCGFTSPAGEPSWMSKYNDAAFGVGYRRHYPDGSRMEFGSDGRLRRAIGRFSDTTRFTWTDTLLTEIRDPMGKPLTLAYSGGKLQSVTDPGGRVTTYAMDGSGRLSVITDPDTVGTTLGYDGNHLLTSLTDRAGAVTNFTYDPLRRVDSTLSPAIQTHAGSNLRPTTVITSQERVAWQPATSGTSAANKKLAVRPDTLYGITVGPGGATVKTTVDRFRNPTKVVGPFGETTTIARDTMGHELVTTEPNGHITRVSYISNHLVSQRKDSTTGRVINFSYVWNANVSQVTGDTPRLDVAYHTGLNGPTGAIDTVYGANRAYLVSVHRPDALGRDTLVKDGAQHTSRMKYDSVWGNLLERKDEQGNITRFHFDAFGRVDSSWAPASGVTVTTYDKLNRRRQVKNPLGHTAQFVYGPATLNRVIDGRGQVYKFAYNALGMLMARHDLGDTTKADTLKYDVAGNLRSLRTRRGDVITMTYDVAGRLRSRSGPDFPVDSFAYDAAGRWSVAWNVNGRDSIAFDSAGRKSYSRQALSGGAYQLTYTYDIRDRLVSRSAPTGGNSVSYKYNSVTGKLDTLCAASACVALRNNSELLTDRRTYNPGLGGSWYHESAFNADHSASSDSFSVAVLDSTFGAGWAYDSAGRIKLWQTPYYQNHRTYDAAGQLTNFCAITMGFCYNEYGGLPDEQAYWYDAAGNRADSAASPVIGAGNRTTSFDGQSMTFDPNGAVISKSGAGATYSYVWDALGRLVEVKNGGVTLATYAYDGLGRRVKKTLGDGTTERYVYDGDQVILDVTGAHAVKVEYGYLPGVDRLFVIKNTQGVAWTGIAITDPKIGTIRGIANLSGGTIRKTYHGLPWGDAASDTGVVTRFRMAGREFDQESKLYYMRARYYDPELGRFLSEDPLGISGGLNLYAYASNDPINRRDPRGMDDCGEGGDESELRSANLSSEGDTEGEEPKCKKGPNDDDGSGDDGPFDTWEQVWEWIDWALSQPFDFASWRNGLVFRSDIFTLYGHLSGLAPGLGVGSFVTMDQIIGYVGRTGLATGNHLHFEMRVERFGARNAVDPYGPQWHNLAQFGWSDPLDDMSNVRSGFGSRDHPVSGERSFHSGIDIAAPAGTPVHAVASGWVTVAGEFGGYGVTVVIWH